MLTKEGCQKRRERLWGNVPEHLEWLLIADPRHVQYLSNFMVQPLSFSLGERCLLLLERDRGATLLGDNFSVRSAAAEAHVDHEVIEPWYDHKHSVINRDHALFNAVKQVSERLYGRSGSVEAEWLPVGAWEVLASDRESHSVSGESDKKNKCSTSLDLGTTLRSMRRSKDPDEIELMKVCMKAGAAGQARAREVIREGISEFEIYREVQKAAIAAAGRPGLVYGDFRACTPTSPKQGGLPTDYKLQAGDLFVLDYSVVLCGYRSDFTNTFAVTEPTEGQKELFAICQAGMKAGEETLKAGVSCAEVYKKVKQPYLDAGKGDVFTHHAGHGLGLGHPEAPILVPESTDTLQAGDVVTLEPGAYEEGTGGMRIEHNYLITETGYERLSQHEIAL